MAIYHCSAKVVSRGKGQSAIAKAAYNARDDLRDEKTGERKNYSSRADEVKFSGVFAPEGAPAWARDRNALWNAAEGAERRKDAQLAREVEISLPHELTDQQREWLVKDYVREAFVREGMIADVNIHAPSGSGDQRNYHAHILLTTREITPEGFGNKVRDWNSKEALEGWRDKLEQITNRQLERHGHDERVDRRSLADQGIDRAPTQHKGITIKEIEARGAVSEVSERRAAEQAAARQIGANDNPTLAELRAEYRDLEREIRSAERMEAARDMSPSAGPTIGDERAALQVLDVATGAIEKLADFVADFFTATPAPQPSPDMVERIIAQRQAAAALENIADSIRQEHPIGVDDLRCLNPLDLKGIREGGDDYLRELVDRMDRDRQREREADRGRTMER